MPVRLVEIKHKKTGATSNAPESQLERYRSLGWEPVTGSEPVTQSPRTAATPATGDTGRKES
jgi:hypothetical protein